MIGSFRVFLGLGLVLGVSVWIGCDKASVVDHGNGKYTVYQYDQKQVAKPVEKTAGSSSLSPTEKKWAEVYDKRHQRPNTPSLSGSRSTRPMKPALTPPLATKEDLQKAAKRIAELKGSVKKGPNGAIISLTLLSGSSDPSQGVSLDDMKLFSRLHDLQSISLEGPDFDDEILVPLAGLKKLDTVKINNSNMGEPTLELLATLPELKSLDIRRDLKLTNQSLNILQKMPKLESLYAHYNSFTNSGMNRISKVKTLRRVDVRGCVDVSDNGAKYLSRLPEIEELWFRGMISNAGVENLAQAAKLRFVEFQDCNDINEQSVPFFKEMKSLKGLRIFRCKGFADDAVIGIATLPLTRLELRDLNVSDRGIASLSGNKTLTTLELSELSGVTSAGLTSLMKTLSTVRDLSFFAIPLDDSGAAALVERLPELTDLTLRAVSLTDAGLSFILKLKKLQSLDLRENTAFTSDQLVKLSSLKSLKRLYLSGTSLSQPANVKALKQLRKALPKCNISI